MRVCPVLPLAVLLAAFPLILASCASPRAVGSAEPADIPTSPELLAFVDGSHWMLTDQMRYRVRNTNHVVVVPAGFVTDFASIPRIAWMVIPKNGRFDRAAIVHDYLYWTQQCTRAQADKIMDEAMRELGVRPVTRTMIYRAVQVGGGGAWEANQRERAADRMPRVVPPQYQSQVPDDATWASFQRALSTAGVRPSQEPNPNPNAGYCAAGN